jgi:hypothetical protein
MDDYETPGSYIRKTVVPGMGQGGKTEHSVRIVRMHGAESEIIRTAPK